MISTKNIKYKKHTLNLPKELNIQSWKIPTLLDDEFSFTLTNTSPAFANAIRICSMEEISTKILAFDYSNLTTGDKFIIPEILQKNINLIMCSQNIPTDAVFELDVANLTGRPLNVHSGDIKQVAGKSGTYFNKNIKLFTLSETTVGIRISNIKPVEGYGKDYSAHNIVTCKYKTLTPINKSVLNTTFTDFSLSYNLNSIIHPKDFVKNIVTTLDNYMTRIQDSIDNKDTFMKITSNGDNTEFHLCDGYYMIGNLLRQYIFAANKSIQSVTVNIIHPESNNISINVVSSSAIKLLKLAITNIKKDLNVFLKDVTKSNI